MGKNKESTGDKDRIISERKAYKRKNFMYSPEKHIKLLDSTIAQGYSHMSYCAAAGIGRTTLVEWRNRYDEFEEAYDRALMKGAEKWDLNNAFVGKEFNCHLWINVMNRRYHCNRPAFSIKGTETSEDLLRLILKKYCSNELEEEQFDRIHSAIRTQIDALELPKINAQFQKHVKETKNKSKK